MTQLPPIIRATATLAPRVLALFLPMALGGFLAAGAALAQSPPREQAPPAAPKLTRGPRSDQRDDGSHTPPQAATRTATLPAGALVLAAKFADAAPESLAKWCRSLGRKDWRSAGADTAKIEKAVAERFPEAGAPARDAAAFLALYERYLAASELEEITATHLKALEKEIDERYRGVRPRNTDASSPKRLDDLELERDTQSRQVAQVGKDVDKVLTALGDFYPRVKGAEPAVLQTLR